MNSHLPFLLVFALALSGCASGDLDDGSSEDIGRTGAGRDASRGSSDTDSDPIDRDLGETTRDVSLDTPVADGSGDGADTSADAALVDVGWEPITASNPKVVAAVEASRRGLLAYCDCCAAAGFTGDQALCLTSAFGGGFPTDECTLAAFERMSTTADQFLDCMTTAFNNLASCNLACGGTCVLCENNYNFDVTGCTNTNPSVIEQMAACAG